jgi:hypothetical protein
VSDEPERRWINDGADFLIEWRGSRWRLQVDAPVPGLRSVESGRAIALGIEGLAARGEAVLSLGQQVTLTGIESIHGRVQATYELDRWGGLVLRASWYPVAHQPDWLDLEVQVSTKTSEPTQGLEVYIASGLHELAGAETAERVDLVVEPRDARAAASSYDGRESASRLTRLITRPLPSRVSTAFQPSPRTLPGLAESGAYVEFVHRHDVARRVFLSATSPAAGAADESAEWITRHALFGHDLEKGVVLRSHLRAIFLEEEFSGADLDSLYTTFRGEPPPLGP